MPDKKVLIIAYYWPPSGGSGVQRWLKFVKYLPQFGWKPFVFTPENPSFDLKDESLLNDVPPEAEVIKYPIWEPYEIFNKLSGLVAGNKSPETVPTGKKKKSLFACLSLWVRGSFFIPDPRKFWVKPSVKFLTQYLRQHNIQTIITTGPPHSMHLIGLKLKQQNPSLKWIVDMRDPWSEWGFLETLNLSESAWARHKALEHEVLVTADEVITVTPTWVKQFEKLGGRPVRLLTNGFDEADFAGFALRPQNAFVVRHIGIVNERCDSRPFMRVIERLCQTNDEFKKHLRIEFVGQVDPAFIQYISEQPLLNEVTRFVAPVSHTEIMNIYATSSALLLVLTGYKNAAAYLPGKMFEYLATGLPVIGIGPVDGDAAGLLKQAGVGDMAEDEAAIARAILSAYQHWKTPVIQNRSGQVQAYSRRAITEQLTGIL